jgi:hypothetical protein
MEKSKKKKTTREDLQKDSLNEPSGLIYWDDYDYSAEYLENQNNTIAFNYINYKLS